MPAQKIHAHPTHPCDPHGPRGGGPAHCRNTCGASRRSCSSACWSFSGWRPRRSCWALIGCTRCGLLVFLHLCLPRRSGLHLCRPQLPSPNLHQPYQPQLPNLNLNLPLPQHPPLLLPLHRHLLPSLLLPPPLPLLLHRPQPPHPLPLRQRRAIQTAQREPRSSTSTPPSGFCVWMSMAAAAPAALASTPMVEEAEEERQAPIANTAFISSLGSPLSP